MKNTFGNAVSMTLFGESHGEAIGAVIDGLAPGIAVDENRIALALSRRRPNGALETARAEKDDFKIVSGVFNGMTAGTPLCILIRNEDTDSRSYVYGEARPSHADYAAYCKYHGFEDYRGGGHFSGRITAAAVAAGAIFASALEGLNITVGTHILKCGEAADREFANTEEDVKLLRTASYPVLDSTTEEKINAEIFKARSDENSIGGITQTAITGIPAGVGEPWFDSVESRLSHVMFSVGGIKGIEFGAGFAAANMRGSEFNDEMRVENGRVVSLSNNNGGVNGGVTNGMPVVFNCAVRPTASIAKMQKSIDFVKNENIDISVSGRHDPALIRRICPVIDAMTAFAVCEMLAERYGTDVFTKGIER